jgi:polar amino acid transport system substrate-binding protein
MMSTDSRFTSLSRRQVLKAVGAAGLALPAVGFLTAFGGSASVPASEPDPLLSKLKKAGFINVGVANDPPATIINPDGSLTGQGPVTVQRIMKRLGVPKLKGVSATFGELVPGLEAGRWDMIAGVISVTAPRCAVIQYSAPLEATPFEIAYYPDAVSPAPKTLADVIHRGYTAGFSQGSAYIQFCENKGMDPSKVVQFPDTTSLLLALKTKRVQVIVGDTGSFNFTSEVMKQNPFHALVGPSDGPFAAGAVAFRKTDGAFANAFNEQFAKMKASGEFNQISKQFRFPPLPKKYESMTAKEACTLAAQAGG